MSVTSLPEAAVGSPVARTVDDFLTYEAEPVLGAAAAGPTDRPASLRVAGIGTTAARALGSAMLADAFATRQMTIADTMPYADPAALAAAARAWDLAIVLSPYKRDVLPALVLASPTTLAAGVADTLLSVGGDVIGFNTNSWAVVAALRTLVPAAGPQRVLLLGAGASARSTVLGITRTWPDTAIVCSARSPEAATELADLVGGTSVAAADTPGVDAAVIVNATTWGETSESEARPYSFPFGGLLQPGRAFFDLNNRRSALAEQALDKACAVLSGTLMQVVTHQCRAALAQRLSVINTGGGS